MSDSILSQGVDLMLFGMGTVFVFLTVLVFCLWLMSSLLTRYMPEDVEPLAANPAPSKPLKVVLQSDAKVDQHTLKVIRAAIDAHRKA